MLTMMKGCTVFSPAMGNKLKGGNYEVVNEQKTMLKVKSENALLNKNCLAKGFKVYVCH